MMRVPDSSSTKLFTDAARIRTVRNELGLSRKEFGSLFGVGQYPVSEWETGQAKPSIYRRAIIEAFGVAADRDGGIRVDLDALLAACGPTYVLWLLLNVAYGSVLPEHDALAPPT